MLTIKNVKEEITTAAKLMKGKYCKQAQFSEQSIFLVNTPIKNLKSDNHRPHNFRDITRRP